jgi:hypothetical protein
LVLYIPRGHGALEAHFFNQSFQPCLRSECTGIVDRLYRPADQFHGLNRNRTSCVVSEVLAVKLVRHFLFGNSEKLCGLLNGLTNCGALCRDFVFAHDFSWVL